MRAIEESVEAELGGVIDKWKGNDIHEGTAKIMETNGFV